MKIRSQWKPTVLPRTGVFLRWSRRLFYTIGIVALGYVGFVLADAKFYQAYQARRFREELSSAKLPIGNDGHPLPVPAEANRAQTDSFHTTGREGTPVGQIEISRIGLTAMIVEGTEDATLRLGVGHITGTALPGQEGNIAMAGHRDTFFRPLRNILKDDEIKLTTLNGSYRYVVDSTKVVGPEEIGVLYNSHEAILTLVTCYPFNYIGSAPQRFIVRAHRLQPQVQLDPTVAR
jgi:sortase A